jgi:tagatose-1,6-bisphosphate aldolase
MTKRVLSVGKYRGLQRASTPQGHFSIVAIDHQDALRRVMRPDAPEAVTVEQIVEFKAQVIRALAPETSGILLDPIYGAAQAFSGGYVGSTGVLIELEVADYQLKPLPLDVTLLPDWNVSKIKRMEADGAKLFFYYNPDDAAHAASQEQALRRLVEACAEHDIPFYAEPIIYPMGEDETTFAHNFSRRVIEAGRRVAGLGVDVLKIEFPVHSSLLDDEALCRAACEQLTAAVDVPWVLLSAGVTFEAFCRQVEIACAAGASGFIGGRSVWDEAAQIADPAERIAWLETTGRERLRMLSAAMSQGRPWMSRLDCEPVSTHWYRSYTGLNGHG